MTGLSCNRLEVTEQKHTDKDRYVRLDELGHDLRTPLSAISRGIQLVQAIVLLLSLGVAACAHGQELKRSDVAAMQNDAPVISPWYGPVPNDTIYGGAPGR